MSFSVFTSRTIKTQSTSPATKYIDVGYFRWELLIYLTTWWLEREAFLVTGESRWSRILTPVTARRHHRPRRVTSCSSSLCSVHVGFFLSFCYVLLVTNPFISKPIINLQKDNFNVFLIYPFTSYYTWDTVIPHFFANSSFASSEG